MKHNLNVTILLLSIFLLTQVFGLYLIKADITNIIELDDGIVVRHGDTTLGERPEMEGSASFIYLVSAILFGTLLILLIMKYGKVNIWKTWFFIAVFLSMSVSLGVLVNFKIAFFLAFIFALLKMFKRTSLIHNLTEILVYSGIALLIVPLLDLFWASMLLIVISLYDLYAVWQSKHMIKMAKFQTKSEIFAGLNIPYMKTNKTLKTKKSTTKKSSKSKLVELSLPKPSKSRNAILGGGDVAFPLIFSGVAMEHLIKLSIVPEFAFIKAVIMSLVITIALGLLFKYAKKDKFYPAMPFVSAGCFIGLLIVLII